MDTTSWLAMLGAAVTSAGLAWFAARLHFGRQLESMRLAADKADKARQLAVQQAQQMRRQIEQMQKEAALQATRRAAPAAAQPPAQTKAERLAEAEVRLAEVAEEPGAGPPTIPSHGFADTQPITRL